MRRVLEFVGAAALTGGAPIGSAQIAKESRPTSQLVEMQAGTSVNDIIDRVIAREHEEMKIINSYRPIVETYVQVYKRKRDTTASLAVLLGPRRLESNSPLRHMIWVSSAIFAIRSGMATYNNVEETERLQQARARLAQ